MSELLAVEQPVQTGAKTTVQTKRSGRGVAILILLGLTLAGMFGGCLLGYGLPKIMQANWSQLDLGQNQALRIIGTDGPEYTRGFYIYLDMASGEVYRCLVNRRYWLADIYNPSKRCDKVTTENVSKVRYECLSGTTVATPQPPGKLVDSLCWSLGAGDDLRYFAVLSDGSVWDWVNVGFREFAGVLEMFWGSLAGLVVGLIAGILAAIFWIVRRSRSHERKVQSES